MGTQCVGVGRNPRKDFDAFLHLATMPRRAAGAYDSGDTAANAALARLEPRSLRYSAAAISLNNSG